MRCFNTGIIRLLRPRQYVKNLFIFLPLIFGLKLPILSVGVLTLGGAMGFCLLASGIYVLNDLYDAPEDRMHPVKKFRPIASGEVTLNCAGVLSIFLMGIGLSILFALHADAGVWGLIYAGMNIAYTVKLKHIPIVDIVVVALGFVIRLGVGSVLSAVPLSHWIVLMTFLLALFLAIAKRRDDVLLALKGTRARKNIDGYNLEFINAVMVLMAGVTIVAYLMYTLSPEIIARIGSTHLFYSGIFVVLGIFRYMQLTFVVQDSGNPTAILLKDRFIQLVLFGWISFFIAVLYFGGGGV